MQDLLNETYDNRHSITPPDSFIKLLIGGEFWTLLSDDNFKISWDALYHTCPWATAFQSREYVTAWYEVFSEKFLPVVVVSQTADQVTGLMTMAIPMPDAPHDKLWTSKIKIIAAGEYEAEYQVWLAEETHGETFIKGALALLKERFPESDILFRFLPANAPVSWITEDATWRNRCVLQEFRRPLLELDDPAMPQLLHLSRQHKTKYNRLKRIGDPVFEKITDLDQFAVLLKYLADQYDFRQGGMFNMNQFRENPLKKDFLMQLFRKGLLHVTILRLNNEVIAAMAATQGKGWVHLQGLNTHSPFHAKNSPGILHFFMAGRYLSDEGFRVFDLTPGGDSYKERFATKYDQVYSLAVTDNQMYRLKRRMRKHVFDLLIKAGYRPMRVETNLKKRVYQLRHQLKAICNGHIPILSEKGITCHYRYSPPLLSTTLSININSLADLLNFKLGGTQVSRWKFLEEAMHRLEDGQHAYTWAEEGRLLCCAWLQETEVQTKSAIFEINYCQQEVKGRLREFLASSQNAIAKKHEAHLPFCIIKATERQICKALEMTENIEKLT